MPDYELTVKLESGFTVKVRPLVPYYLDFVNDLHPYLDAPTRRVTLVGGDLYTIPYIIPSEPPTASSEDYEIYLASLHVLNHNAKVDQRRNRTRQDYLLSTCVTIVDGPVSIDSDDWLHSLLELNPDLDITNRKLLFLKSVVIGTVSDMEKIMRSAMYREVQEQEVVNALEKF